MYESLNVLRVTFFLFLNQSHFIRWLASLKSGLMFGIGASPVFGKLLSGASLTYNPDFYFFLDAVHHMVREHHRKSVKVSPLRISKNEDPDLAAITWKMLKTKYSMFL